MVCRLMEGDFVMCMKTLQRYPPVEVITRIAFRLPGVF